MTEVVEQDDSVQVADTLPETIAEESRSQSILLSAGRLEAQLASKPEQVSTSSSDIVAWSIDNLLAIVDSRVAIKLVHLSSPKRIQIIATQEKPYLLTFSPRGDALFAAFRESKTCCLWIKTSVVLNEWKLKQSWTDWQGKVLDLQWLSATRGWTPKPKLSRRAAKGPQFSAERVSHAVGAVAICEGGQVVLFHGNVEGETGWETQTIQVPIPSQERIAKAAIGLIPDESMALIAFTKRMSSKATLPGSSAEGDALGMFFEGADEVVTLDRQQQDSHYFDDGQDKIELVEVRLDMAASPSTVSLRPLWPLYLSSYDNPSIPFASSLTQLIWIDGDGKGDDEGVAARLRLFGAFYADNATTLRSWDIQREESETLSEAFTKLEASKSKVNDEEKEDWIAKSSKHQTYPDFLGGHYQVAPANDRLVCSWIHSPVAATLWTVLKPQIEYRLVDLTSLQVLEGNVLPTLQGRTCLLALSPSGSLAAQIVNQKVNVVQTTKEVRWSQDDVIAYWPAVLEGCDIADLVRTSPCDLQSLSTALQLKESAFHQIQKVIKIAAQMNQDGSTVRARNSRLLLELVECFGKLKECDQDNYFDHTQLWTLLSILEWIVWLLETLAKQAYLEHAATSAPSPTHTNTETAAVPTVIDVGGADLLALMTHRFARRLMTECIVKIVKFCNWLHRINRSKEQVKGMMINAQFRETLKSTSAANNGNQQSGAGLWSLADNLRLAQMRVNEVMLKSAVDLSQVGRLLKSFKNEEVYDETKPTTTPKWWAALETGNRAKMARVLVEGQCIKMALSLFCPSEEGQEKEQRDILTKAKLNGKERRLICLACQGQTQLPLQLTQKCVCGCASWWSIMQ